MLLAIICIVLLLAGLGLLDNVTNRIAAAWRDAMRRIK